MILALRINQYHIVLNIIYYYILYYYIYFPQNRSSSTFHILGYFLYLLLHKLYSSGSLGDMLHTILNSIFLFMFILIAFILLYSLYNIYIKKWLMTPDKVLLSVAQVTSHFLEKYSRYRLMKPKHIDRGALHRFIQCRIHSHIYHEWNDSTWCGCTTELFTHSQYFDRWYSVIGLVLVPFFICVRRLADSASLSCVKISGLPPKKTIGEISSVLQPWKMEHFLERKMEGPHQLM